MKPLCCVDDVQFFWVKQNNSLEKQKKEKATLKDDMNLVMVIQTVDGPFFSVQKRQGKLN